MKTQQLGYSVGQLCGVHGISRQAYYKSRKQCAREDQAAEKALALVRQERCLQKRLGTRKLYRMYQQQFQALGYGRDKLFALLRRQGLLVERPRRTKRTTYSGHGLRCYQNLLKDTVATGPGQAMVSDITYVETLEGFAYAALVTDAYSRKILGFDLSQSLSVEGSLRALRMALPAVRAGVLHHSDRGVQYCSHAYLDLLGSKQARVSMTEAGNPYENAQAERVNGILKQEYGLGEVFVSFEQARRALKEAVKLYNERRPHLALAYRTPDQVHQAFFKQAA